MRFPNLVLAAMAILLSTLILSGVFLTVVHAAGPETINEVRYIAKDFSFSGPDRIPAGRTTIHVTNEGPAPHNVVLIKLSEGKTAGNLQASLTRDPFGRLPAWAKYMGGPNALSMGQNGTATIQLTEGRYALTCLIVDSNGILHAASGMIKAVEVIPATGAPAPEPEPELTITMVDFGFKISKHVTAGTRIIRAVNKGTVPHGSVVVRLDPGVTAKDIADAFTRGPTDKMVPGKLLGGFSPVEPGNSGYFSIDFKPGNYALICFMPDRDSNKNHLMLGMTHDFTVK